jgi:hypothetical protein
MSSPPPRASIAAIVRKAFPWIVLAGPKSYRVETVYADGRIDLVPATESKLLPALPLVEQWCGIAGGDAIPVKGSRVVVEFLDNDETQPIIRNYQPRGQAGGQPTEAKIDAVTLKLGPTATAVQLAGTGPAVARVGDSVGGGLLAVAMVGVTPTFTYTPPGGGVPQVGASVTLSGSVITSGSSKVTSA